MPSPNMRPSSITNMADSEKWMFRGEGNACLVLANLEDKMVFRLPKSKHWGKGYLATVAKNKLDRIHEELQLVIDYMRHVMQPLLSPAFVVLPELCCMEVGLTEEAERQIQVSRPAQRKGKEVEPSSVDPTLLSAHVMPDLCYIRGSSSKYLDSPTLSVEIKPKKAFLNSPCANTDTPTELSTDFNKLHVCKFCLHKRLKAKEGQWPVTSRYCPLDLFSGDRQRMKEALIALAETPQNNFRICQDGKEIHGAWNMADLTKVLEDFFRGWPSHLTNGHQKQRLISMFLDLVLEALLSVPETEEGTPCEETIQGTYPVQYCWDRYSHVQSDHLCSSPDELIHLPAGCVLERILTTQRLDTEDIDKIFPIYLQLEEYLKEHPSLRSSLCLNGPYIGPSWLDACARCEPQTSSLIEEDVDTLLCKVKRFLVSKTVQDCSIMVALQRVPDSLNEASVGRCLKDACGQLYRFSVSIIDLDPKPFTKIATYYRQHCDIMRAYQESCLDHKT